MSDLDEVVKMIRAGTYDGHLNEIATACIDRVRDGAVQMNWRLRLGDDEWTAETVTVGELKFAEARTTITDPVTNRPRRAVMAEIDPRHSAEHCVALLVAHLHCVGDLPLQKATEQAESLTAKDLKGVVGEIEVVNPPKGDAGASTTS